MRRSGGGKKRPPQIVAFWPCALAMLGGPGPSSSISLYLALSPTHPQVGDLNRLVAKGPLSWKEQPFSLVFPEKQPFSRGEVRLQPPENKTTIFAGFSRSFCCWIERKRRHFKESEVKLPIFVFLEDTHLAGRDQAHRKLEFEARGSPCENGCFFLQKLSSNWEFSLGNQAPKKEGIPNQEKKKHFRWVVLELSRERERTKQSLSFR